MSARGGEKEYRVLLDSLEHLKSDDTSLFALLNQRLIAFEANRKVPDSLVFRRVESTASRVKSKQGPDSAFVVYLDAYDRAIKQGDSLLLAGLCYRMGKWKLGEGSNRLAQGFYTRAQGIYNDGAHPRELARTTLAQAQVLRELSDPDGAQRTAMEAIRLTTIAYPKASAEAASAFLISGNVFADIRSDSMARLSYRKAFDIYAAIPDSVGMAEALGNVGLLYRKSNPDSALVYYNRALTLAPPHRFPFESVVFLYNRTNLLLDRKQFDQAQAGYDSLLSLCRREGIYQGIPRVYSGYSSIATQRGNNRQAIALLREARQFADSMSMKQVSQWLMREEADALDVAGEAKEALSMLKLVRKIDDSVLNINKLRAISELELQYRTELREQEMKQLRTRMYALGTIAGLLAAIAGLSLAGLLLYRQRNRSYRLLVRQYELNREEEKRVRKSAVGKNKESSLPLPMSAESPETALPTTPQDPPAGEGPDEEDDDEGNAALYPLFEQLISGESLWLDPDLKVEDVAGRLGISARRMTAVMRAGGTLTFLQYINRCRVDHVVKLFKDRAQDPLRTDALGLMSGFSSRSHFYRVFKEITGVTPGVFREITTRQPAD